MPRRRKSDGAYDVTGPNIEAKFSASENGAITAAQNFACAFYVPGKWYVSLLGKRLWIIERTEQGVILTYRAAS